jgi:SAM-dependent methyltransferase
LAAPLLHWFDRRRLGLLGVPHGALLDVGAGRGRFVAAARAAGWDATGIEPSRRSSAENVSAETLEDFELPSGTLAAATVWHVLEHLEDPAAALDRVIDWLEPGGVLVVGVPNLASLQARLADPRWFHLDLPRHRWHFTADGVVSLIERHGLVVERVEHVLLEHNPFGLWQSLVNRVTPTPSWLFHVLKRNAPVRAADLVPTLLALPLLPVAVAVELAAGLARRGGTVAVVARKPR